MHFRSAKFDTASVDLKWKDAERHDFIVEMLRILQAYGIIIFASAHPPEVALAEMDGLPVDVMQTCQPSESGWGSISVLQKNSVGRLLCHFALFDKWRFDTRQSQTGRLDFLDYCAKSVIYAEDLVDYNYWEDEYKRNRGPVEWFRIGFTELKPAFSAYIPDKHWSILELGCGNSTLSEEMWRNSM